MKVGKIGKYFCKGTTSQQKQQKTQTFYSLKNFVHWEKFLITPFWKTFGNDFIILLEECCVHCHEVRVYVLIKMTGVCRNLLFKT